MISERNETLLRIGPRRDSDLRRPVTLLEAHSGLVERVVRASDSLAELPAVLQVVSPAHALAAAVVLHQACGRGDEFYRNPRVRLAVAGFAVESHARHLMTCLASGVLRCGEVEFVHYRSLLTHLLENSGLFVKALLKGDAISGDLCIDGGDQLRLITLARAFQSVRWPHSFRPVEVGWATNWEDWVQPVSGGTWNGEADPAGGEAASDWLLMSGPLARLMVFLRGGSPPDGRREEFVGETLFFSEALGSRAGWLVDPHLSLAALALESLLLVRLVKDWVREMDEFGATDPLVGLGQGAVIKDGVYWSTVQAPRGILGYRMTVRDGQLAEFSHVTPTQAHREIFERAIVEQVFALDTSHVSRVEQEQVLAQLVRTFNLCGPQGDGHLQIEWAD